MSMITLLKVSPEAAEQSQKLKQLLDKLLAAFGGPDFFFQPGEKLLFLLDLTLPAESTQGVNFDIRLAWALTALARERGADKVTFAFRPETGFTAPQILERSGYGALAQMEQVEFIDLSAMASQPRPSSVALAADQVSVYAPLLEADVVLSLVKYRVAEGRLFGSALHSLAAASPDAKNVHPEREDRLLADLYSVVTPDLFIIDALRGQAGFQPQTGDCLLAAADAVAADAVLAALGGLPVRSVESLVLAAQYGLGTGDPAGVAMYGDDMSELMLKPDGQGEAGKEADKR